MKNLLLIQGLVKNQNHPDFFPKETDKVTDSLRVLLSSMVSKMMNMNNGVREIISTLGKISSKIKTHTEGMVLFRDTVSLKLFIS